MGVLVQWAGQYHEALVWLDSALVVEPGTRLHARVRAGEVPAPDDDAPNVASDPVSDTRFDCAATEILPSARRQPSWPC